MTTFDLWSVMPLAILALGALLILIIGAVRPGGHCTGLGVVATLGAAVWTVVMPPIPASPTLGIVFGPFARFFSTLFLLAAAVTLLLSHQYNRERRIQGEEYPATVLFAAFGMVTVSASTNLLTLFLGVEAMTFAFYILVAMDLNSTGSAEAGLKYLLLGAISAACIAFGIALLYAAAGTLDTREVARLTLGGGSDPLALAGWGLLLTGIAFKISLVPAHLWTPDVYQGAPTPVVAFLSTASKGAAIAFLLLLLLGGDGFKALHGPLWWLSLLSMVVGNLAALLQSNVKRMLAYSSIAQMGYVVLALLTGTEDGFTAVIFYVVAYTAMNLAAFGAVAVLCRGEAGEEIGDLQGMGYGRPFPAAVLALAMFALAGIPPTAGFIGKFFIFYSAFRGGEIPLAVIGILTAATSAFYYLRVVVNLYMHAAVSPGNGKISATESLALAASAAAVFAIGIYPPPLLQVIGKLIP
ncbi:NADH dehydrogenase I, N subunit [Geotalea daltonii FRC-32]|uniref:NADH-quinone oxidoreductase subunit N n=1 Tax=Geotalea daltonii (strain DSM 22248 / JCM 15807 / FRC-32) TaxID=316067 RepID=B9M3Z2_GEODF|nr:NADH-quinone oxidoreductase subunit N [Geotalea daltonii]ACM19635.1 NADH dehydrogenase I, N subunit [Geotalea daltonii FRC-32]